MRRAGHSAAFWGRALQRLERKQPSPLNAALIFDGYGRSTPFLSTRSHVLFKGATFKTHSEDTCFWGAWDLRRLAPSLTICFGVVLFLMLLLRVLGCPG
eukprot:1160045-Pelagomonas_calceolata.AAC.9